AAGVAADDSSHTGPIEKIVFACDAGMGSSAMGATVLRKKVRAAGYDDIEVTTKAISSLSDEWDVVVTQMELTDRARQRTGSAVHVSVDQFMNSPRYDEVVELVRQRNAEDADTEAAGAVGAAAAPAPAAPPHGRHAAPRPQEEAPGAAAEAGAPSQRATILAPDASVLSGTASDSASGIDE